MMSDKSFIEHETPQLPLAVAVMSERTKRLEGKFLWTKNNNEKLSSIKMLYDCELLNGMSHRCQTSCFLFLVQKSGVSEINFVTFLIWQSKKLQKTAW